MKKKIKSQPKTQKLPAHNFKPMRSVTPEEAVEFIEGMRQMAAEKDEPTVAISVRVPANILRTLKLKAKSEGKRYQSLLIDYIRQGLRKS